MNNASVIELSFLKLMMLLMGFALLLVLLVVIVLLVPRDAAKTLSQHAASSRRTYWLLVLALMGPGILTYLFIWKWFMPSVGLGDWFIWVLAIGFVCQAVTAFVPDSTGWKHKTHLVSGYGLAAVLVIFMAILFFASDISGIGRILTAQFVMVSVGLLLLVLFHPWFKKRYLYFQAFVILDWIAVFLLVPFV